MTRFLKKIRSEHLSNNNIVKYLKYTIGEILIVGIGILFAMQINTWSEQRHEKKTEIQQLYQIKLSLESDRESLASRIEQYKFSLKSGQALYTHLKDKKPLNDTIKQMLVIPLQEISFSSNTAAYENLKSEGLFSISNDSLKLSIIRFYDQELKFIITKFADQSDAYISSIVAPYYSKHFELLTEGNNVFIEPNDYDELLLDRELTNIISTVNTFKVFGISTYESTLESLSSLIKQIEDELERNANGK